tara:strand:- start:107 stop:616 length:510 start_codon:yes stop_codon:yes gene_type:complete
MEIIMSTPENYIKDKISSIEDQIGSYGNTRLSGSNPYLTEADETAYEVGMIVKDELQAVITRYHNAQHQLDKANQILEEARAKRDRTGSNSVFTQSELETISKARQTKDGVPAFLERISWKVKANLDIFESFNEQYKTDKVSIEAYIPKAKISSQAFGKNLNIDAMLAE